MDTASLMFISPVDASSHDDTIYDPTRWSIQETTKRANSGFFDQDTEHSQSTVFRILNVSAFTRGILRTLWECFIGMIVFYYWGVATLSAGYDFNANATNPARVVVECIFTVVFIIDAYTQRHVLRESPLGMICAVVPCLPLDIIMSFVAPEAFIYFAFLRTIKAHRFRSCFLYDLQSVQVVNPTHITFIYKIIPWIITVFELCFLIHTLTVIRIWVVNAAVDSSKKEGPRDAYRDALYYVMYTLCTVGYGDTENNNVGQKIYSLVLFLFAAALCGVTFGLITAFLQQGNIQHERRGVLRSTVSLLEFLEVPEAVATSVLSFQNYLVHNTISATVSDVVGGFPEPLQDRIHVFLTDRIVSSVPDLAACGKHFCLKLCSLLSSIVYCPADIVVGAGETPEAIYIIAYGVLEVYGPHFESKPPMQEGCLIGTRECIKNTHHTDTVVALTFCDTLSLDKLKFQIMCREYGVTSHFLPQECINPMVASDDNSLMSPTSPTQMGSSMTDSNSGSQPNLLKRLSSVKIEEPPPPSADHLPRKASGTMRRRSSDLTMSLQGIRSLVNFDSPMSPMARRKMQQTSSFEGRSPRHGSVAGGGFPPASHQRTSVLLQCGDVLDFPLKTEDSAVQPMGFFAPRSSHGDFLHPGDLGNNSGERLKELLKEVQELNNSFHDDKDVEDGQKEK